jgi:hypothetical protein
VMRTIDTGVSATAYGDEGEVSESRMWFMLWRKVSMGRYWSRVSLTESFVPVPRFRWPSGRDSHSRRTVPDRYKTNHRSWAWSIFLDEYVIKQRYGPEGIWLVVIAHQVHITCQAVLNPPKPLLWMSSLRWYASAAGQS